MSRIAFHVLRKKESLRAGRLSAERCVGAIRKNHSFAPPALLRFVAVALFVSALLAMGASTASAADMVWVGGDTENTSNFTYSGNWQNNLSPTWGYTNSLKFSQNLNSNVTGLNYNYGSWQSANDIFWDTTFNVSRTLTASNGGGIGFKTRIENNSSFTQTVAMELSGGQDGASDIQLNPVNGSLIFSGTLWNDFEKDYVVWGSVSSTTTTLTLNTALGTNADPQSAVDFTVSGGRNSNVQVNASQVWGGTTTVNSGAFTAANGVTLASSAIVVGGGTVATTSANTFADAATLTVNSGRLSIGGSDTVASLAGSGGTVDIASGATLTAGNAGSTSYAGSITGSGGFTKVGSGTFTLSAASSYTGTTTVSAGRLSLASANLLSDSSAVTGAAGAVFALGGNETIGSLAGSLDVVLGSSRLTVGGNGQSTTYSGGISGSGGLTKSGSGTLTLSGNNSYSGGTTVSGGRLVGTTASLQGAITNNAAVEFAQATSGTYAGIMSGSGSLTMAGTGTTTLTGINTYTGLTTVDAGTLILRAGAFGTGILPGHAVVNNGGTLQIFAQAQSGIAPTTNTTIVTVNGGGTLAFTGAGSNQDDMAYLGTVNLSNSGGSGAVVNSPDGSGIRFGNNGRNGTVNSDGTTTNTFGANIVLVNNGGGTTMTFNTGTSNALVVSGGIADYTGLTGAPVVFSGPGTTTLTGTNTYAGTTTITNSTLVVSGLLGGGNYGAGITDNGSLVFSNPGNQTLSGVVSGSGTLTKAGPGTVTLSQANSFTGGALVSQGALVGNASASFGSGAIVLGDGNTGTNSIVLMANTTDNTTIANAITVANLGTGLVSIGGTNTGATSANAWTGTLTLNRNVQVFNDTPHAGGRTSFIGQITGSGGITVTQGRGRVTLQNTTNNFTGPVVVDSGATLQLDVATGVNEVIPNSAAVTVNGSLNFASGGGTETIGSLSGSGTVSSVVAGNYSLVVGGSTNTTFSGAINNGSGVIGLTKSGAGTLTLAGSNGFTGGAALNAGTLAVGSASALGSSGTISFGGGTLQYSASNTTDYSGRFSNAAGQQYSIDTNGQNVTLGSNLTSSGGSFTKLGGGNLILSGSSTYSGATTVSAGRLSVNGSLGNTAVTVQSGAEVGGSGAIGGVVNVLAGGTLSPGNSIQSLAVGATTFSGSSTFEYEYDSTNPASLAAAADLLVVNGNLTINAGAILTLTDLAGSPSPFVNYTTTFALISYSGAWNNGLFTYNGSELADGDSFLVGSQKWQIDYNRMLFTGLANFTGDYLTGGSFVAITAVPEPSTWAMALAGLACGVGIVSRRRRTRP
jgi:autotransporter-associated beta strand protein